MPANNDDEVIRLRETLTQMRASLESIQAERDAAHGEVRVLRVERDLLKEQLNAFIRKVFAAKSEARGTEQRDLFFNEAEALAIPGAAPAQEVDSSESVQVPAHARAKRGRKPLDPALPREVIRHELPESERVCRHDGSTLQAIGVEASEQLDIIPQQVRVIRHERVKYACPCCDQSLRVAPVPARIIPKGLLTEAALAWVISAKFQDALPLYRQAALLGRFGGELSRNTLAASVVRVGQAVQPIINLLRDTLLDSDLIHGDETELQVLKEPGRAAQSKSYLWAQMTGQGPPIHLFSYAPSRSGTTAGELYRGAKKGTALLTDGYETYESLARGLGLVHLGCWAHARRRFVEAQAALPKSARTADQPAAQFIAAIGTLYALEARAKAMSAEDRQQLRERESKPVLGKIEALLHAHQHAVIPGSLLGKALHYLAGQWPKLTRYIDNGSYPIDNNPCENAIRPFVIGRRNWLFADSVAGAKASANLYSLIETAKANGVEPYRYLVRLFTALPRARSLDDYEALLPWRVPAESS